MSIGDVTSPERGSGARYNDGKPPMELIPLRALYPAAYVFGYGTNKYDASLLIDDPFDWLELLWQRGGVSCVEKAPAWLALSESLIATLTAHTVRRGYATRATQKSTGENDTPQSAATTTGPGSSETTPASGFARHVTTAILKTAILSTARSSSPTSENGGAGTETDSTRTTASEPPAPKYGPDKEPSPGSDDSPSTGSLLKTLSKFLPDKTAAEYATDLTQIDTAGTLTTAMKQALFGASSVVSAIEDWGCSEIIEQDLKLQSPTSIRLSLPEKTEAGWRFGNPGWNWAKGMRWSVPLGCMQRHMAAIQAGELLDPESGLPHVGHLLCNALMLSHFMMHFPELNDLPAQLTQEFLADDD